MGGDFTLPLIKTLELATESQIADLENVRNAEAGEKIAATLQIFKSCGVDAWANELKEKFITEAFRHLDDIAVLSARKQPLKELADFLMQRDY